MQRFIFSCHSHEPPREGLIFANQTYTHIKPIVYVKMKTFGKVSLHLPSVMLTTHAEDFTAANQIHPFIL